MLSVQMDKNLSNMDFLAEFVLKLSTNEHNSCKFLQWRMSGNKANKPKEASSCLMEWLNDGIIHDMLCLATYSFDLIKKGQPRRSSHRRSVVGGEID